MNHKSRLAFNAYLEKLSILNGEDFNTLLHGHRFSVAPAVEQRVEARMQESSEFLRMINIMGIDNQQGEKLGLGIGGTLASTTDTSNKDRQTQDPMSWDKFGYVCTPTDFDTHMTYGKIDAWAHLLDFQDRMRDATIKRSALDRILIGWNGVVRSTDSNRTTNPLLQDVNIGWLEKARQNKSASVMTEGKTAGEVRIGEGGDYNNLDAAVTDAINNLVAPWYTEDTALVVVLGRELLADKYFPLIQEHGSTPTEANALDMVIGQKRVGGKKAVSIPGFPPRSFAITRLDNLSLYWQIGSRRRSIVENAKRNRIEDYNSTNEAYVIEDHDGFGAVENIVQPNGEGGWA